ncbi:unnamed protein product [Arabis nemorensis]|uniref:CCHC-type domain-containing protein n=1 Tax=Arabis nemorensis TaxID=586526 RepID=A0A565AX87_9BRAS|nr:unnamed protein product [Arabis nemorensis]
MPYTTNSTLIKKPKPSQQPETKGIQPNTKEKQQTLSLNPLRGLEATTNQGTSTVFKNSSEITFYRCKNKGHIAKSCPSKKEKINTSLGEEDASRNFAPQATKQEKIQTEVNEPRKEVTTLSSKQEDLIPEALNKKQELNTTQSLNLQEAPEKEENQVTTKRDLILSGNDCSNAFLIHLSSRRGEKISGNLVDIREEPPQSIFVISDQKKDNGEPISILLKTSNQLP